MSALLPETTRKVINPEFLRSAAKQSSRCHVIPLRLRRAIDTYLQEEDMGHMKRKVLRLTESFSEIKDVNRMLPMSTAKELVNDPFKAMATSKRWKIKSGYGDIGLSYRDDETLAYAACRMPAVYSACFRVLSEIRRRVPDFSPAKVLDFGSGTGSAFWALREVWPRSLERVNLVEPSQSMQRAGRGLLRDIKHLPLIHSYGSIQSLRQDIKKSGGKHDLVIASYVLGEIPSSKDRETIVRQLWDLTRDILVLVEPGTPEGSKIISQMRSHILWMENRKCRKRKATSDGASEKPAASANGAFIVAPRSNGAPMRGFEDEKFSYVAFRRGQRPEEPWPLDGIKLETQRELRAKRSPEDLEIDYEDQFEAETNEIVPYEVDASSCDSDATEFDEEEGEKAAGHAADLGSGWARIVFPPQTRGRRVEFDVCRATKRDGSQGSFEHLVITRAKSPALHHLARKSFWGDLWPC